MAQRNEEKGNKVANSRRNPIDIMNRILRRRARIERWVVTTDISSDILKESGRLFACGEDEKAELLRDVGQKFRLQAQILRKDDEAATEAVPSWEDLYNALDAEGGWGDE